MILEGDDRRQAIMNYLVGRTTPVNGTELAKRFGVSRQVIVQDIALLRAKNRDILSTNRGYLFYQPTENHHGYSAVILVKHTADETLEEMRSVVDYGGRMLDVLIDHDLYGQIRADLMIFNIDDAVEFCDKLKNSKSKPLKELTADYHYHTITAPSEKALQLIINELKEKGFLIS